MPELPEVETSCRGITPFLINQKIVGAVVRNRQLRWPIPSRLGKSLAGQTIHSVTRRAKYILLGTHKGTLILHLGMSGHLHIVTTDTLAEKHDHFDLLLSTGYLLRLTDPRRFGAVLWTTKDPAYHRLLQDIGPEPLSDSFDSDYLYQRSRHRQCTIRDFLLNGRMVAGIGNIYANESLYRAGIRPTLAAGRLSHRRVTALVSAIKTTLTEAINAGGTTLRDFKNVDGRPGYFQHDLLIYGRANESCRHCGNDIKAKTIHGRRLYYCPTCQT